jgi:hypothetical protein
MTTLTFKFFEDSKYKTGKFDIDELKIIGSGEDTDIEYDDIKFYIDGKLYDGDRTTWAGQRLSASDIFEQVLSAYLREETNDYKNFEGFEIFKQMESLKEWKDDLLVKFPYYDYGLRIYELDLATPASKYYHSGDMFLVLNNNNEIVTDMECFYESAFYEDLCDILKDEVKCLYKDESVDRMIKELGGPEKFLEEYDN